MIIVDGLSIWNAQVSWLNPDQKYRHNKTVVLAARSLEDCIEMIHNLGYPNLNINSIKKQYAHDGHASCIFIVDEKSI